MADVILLFVAALFVIGGVVAIAVTIGTGRRRREVERSQEPARLRAELDQIDQRIRRVNQAATDADLARLDQSTGFEIRMIEMQPVSRH